MSGSIASRRAPLGRLAVERADMVEPRRVEPRLEGAASVGAGLSASASLPAVSSARMADW
eukprot:4202874-Prymnesium_polylepis.2